MLTKVVTISLLVVGIINFLPVLGLFSADRMSALYGVSIADSNLEILMKHRALLFGLVGGFILAAAFLPAFQPAAFVLAGISMIGFLLIAWQVGDYNLLIRKIMLIDVIGCVALAVSVTAWLMSSRSG